MLIEVIAGIDILDRNGNPQGPKLVRSLREKLCWDQVSANSPSVDWKENSKGMPMMVTPVYRTAAEAL